MNEQLTELLRLLRNLIRVGTIIAVDADKWLCRVGTGDLETNWLPWLTSRAGNARTWWMPSEGEQVLLLSIGGELTTAFVLPAIFSDEFSPPSVSPQALVTIFPDGARFEYEPESSRLLIEGVKNVVIKADEQILFDTPKVLCSTLLETSRLLVTGGGEMKGDVKHSGGELSSNGVVVDAHKHKGVKMGDDMTGEPIK